MSPLELEVYHHMRNVIGVHPGFYEFIFTVDADTVCALIHCAGAVITPCHQSVTTQSLNRLVAAAIEDSSIVGICGETKLQNEEGSWWTMIQVGRHQVMCLQFADVGLGI